MVNFVVVDGKNPIFSYIYALPVKVLNYILFTLSWLFLSPSFSQTAPFKENSKWGIKENGAVIVQPLFDTIFNFDSTGKVCLACFRSKGVSASKFIKVITTSYACNYLNKKGERLVIRNMQNDTFGVFPLSKTTVKQYSDNSPFFTVTSKNKKYILYKNFQQLTFRGYYDISLSPDPKFYYTSFINEGDIVLAGLTNEREEEVIPHQYSTIKITTSDSLIVACSAGVRRNAEDEVFDYEGKRVLGTMRHIDLATKHFLIHKFFEPKEYYLIYNISNKEEKKLIADEIGFYQHDEILIRLKDEWYIYDLITNQKKLKQP